MLHNRESNRGTPGHQACYLYRQGQVARPVLNFLWHVGPSARPMRNSDGAHNRRATTTNHQTSFFPEVSIFTGVGRNPNTSSARPRRRHTYLSPARLAQSAERKALNLVVVGSSPTVGVWAAGRFCAPVSVTMLDKPARTLQAPTRQIAKHQSTGEGGGGPAQGARRKGTGGLLVRWHHRAAAR
jgi:hypothetical protein